MIDYWLLIFGTMGVLVVLGLLTVALPSLWAAHKRAQFRRWERKRRTKLRMELRAMRRRGR